MPPPVHRRLRPAALALLVAAELSAGSVGLVTQGGASHNPAPSAGGNPAGVGSAPSRVRGAGTPPNTTPAATSPAAGSGPTAASAPGGAAAVAAPGGAYAPPPATPAQSRGYPGRPGGSSTRNSVQVSCQTDLPLDRSPDTGYNFLCQAGGAPLTWARSDLVVYAQDLSLVQSAALDVAVGQWESLARFSVTYTTDESAADVVVTAAPLDSSQPGYTEDGYTTVSYRCADRCAYYHAKVTLSSTASLTSTDWISTVLHELGHVAGLNHVSKPGEVMYPYLTLSSPVLYASGDDQGLDILAAERGA